MVERHTPQVTDGVGGWIRRLGFVAVVLFAVTAVTRAQGGAAPTNDDVVKMVRAQLAASIILTTIQSASSKFDLSPAGLITLKEAGVEDRIIEAMQAKAQARAGASTDATTRSAPEKSELLVTSKDPEFILRNFKTMLVDATPATYFGSQQMKAAPGANRDFATLKVSIVDDPAVADVVLTVNYTLPWAVTAIASDEPVNGTGDGDTEPDWGITSPHAVSLRAERAGTGDGRVYTITIAARDAANNTSTATTTVTMPHNR